MESNKIYIVGIGPGDSKYITYYANELIQSANFLVGGHRHLSIFSHSQQKTFPITNNLDDVISFIKENYQRGKLVVLASGDPGFYGILNFLNNHFSNEDLEVIPGISSIQLACARLKLSWHDICLTSVHGRPLENLLNVLTYSKIALLTDSKNTPEKVASFVLKNHKDRKVFICENLSAENERIIETTLSNVSKYKPDSFSVMVITECI